MAQVHNWQLGRPMAYPYEAAYPERQFAFVFNINRCLACQSCTMACKSTWTFSKGQEHMWWANVETKPYGGYPMFWDMKILQLLDRANPDGTRWTGAPSADRRQPYGRFDGRTIFEAERMLTPDSARVLGYLPADEQWNSPNIYEDNPVGSRGVPGEFHKTGEALPEHKTWFFYLARICNHCSYPACLAACPRKRSTSARRTASSSSTSRSAADTASAWRRVRTRSRCTAATRASPRSASPATRAWKGRTPRATACPRRPAAWPPASARSGCRGSSR